MSAAGKTRLVSIFVALLVGAAVWTASAIQSHAGNEARGRQVEAQLLLTSMLDMETGVRGFQLTGKQEFLEPYVPGRRAYERAAVPLQSYGGAALTRADEAARRWQRLAE